MKTERSGRAGIVLVIYLALGLLGFGGVGAALLGCGSTPKKLPPAAAPISAGPQVSSQPVVTPHIEVKPTGSGATTVEAPSKADTTTSASRPEVTVAPKAEVTGQMYQDLQSTVNSQQRQIDAANAAIAGMELKVGNVQGNLETTAHNYELSANQLSAFTTTLQTQLDAQKQAMASQSTSFSTTQRLLTGIIIGLCGGILIALVIGAPTNVLVRIAVGAGGAVVLGAGILKYFVG